MIDVEESTQHFEGQGSYSVTGKCRLNMSQLVFIGHVLSACGTGPTEVKVKAVEAREPETAP